VEKLMEVRMGLGFVCREKPWPLLDRRGDDSDGTILNEMCRQFDNLLYRWRQGCCSLCSCLTCRATYISVFTHGIEGYSRKCPGG
jgi:hypothetical protein